jgi:CrcB protein
MSGGRVTALWVGVGGFFGAVARYLVSGWVSRVDEAFPWGTFVVNISGSFVLGLLVGLMGDRVVLHPQLRIGITVGFIGAYTTFSTFALETFEFGETKAIGLAIANIALSVVAGLLAVWGGLALGRSL